MYYYVLPCIAMYSHVYYVVPSTAMYYLGNQQATACHQLEMDAGLTQLCITMYRHVLPCIAMFYHV